MSAGIGARKMRLRNYTEITGGGGVRGAINLGNKSGGATRVNIFGMFAKQARKPRVRNLALSAINRKMQNEK
jgi:hypothetical protein